MRIFHGINFKCFACTCTAINTGSTVQHVCSGHPHLGQNMRPYKIGGRYKQANQMYWCYWQLFLAVPKLTALWRGACDLLIQEIAKAGCPVYTSTLINIMPNSTSVHAQRYQCTPWVILYVIFTCRVHWHFQFFPSSCWHAIWFHCHKNWVQCVGAILDISG